MKNKELSPTMKEDLLREPFNKCAFAEMRESAMTGEKSLHAIMRFSPGDKLTRFQAKEYLAEPNRFTVQLAENKHIVLAPDHLQYINHSCRPNVFFDIPNRSIICLRPISIGDEITFFYPSTEWSMSQGFYCKCGSPSCLGHISGAQYVLPDVLKEYRLSEFIRQRHLRNNHNAVFRQEHLPSK